MYNNYILYKLLYSLGHTLIAKPKPLIINESNYTRPCIYELKYNRGLMYSISLSEADMTASCLKHIYVALVEIMN